MPRASAIDLQLVKHFDVDLDWVSKIRNQQMSTFHMLDDDTGMEIQVHDVRSWLMISRAS